MFATTRWTLVQIAGGETADAQQALEQLCSIYWRPIYAYLRRQMHSQHDAEDLTQEFFALLLRRKIFARVAPGSSTFRSFLLTALKHHVMDTRSRDRAQKRGGGVPVFSLSNLNGEEQLSAASVATAPEIAFDRRWAELVIERAHHRLRQDYERREDERTFDALIPFLRGDPPENAYQTAAGELGSRLETIRLAVHRLRKRFRDSLRAEIAQTVGSEAEVDDELKYLLRAVSG